MDRIALIALVVATTLGSSTLLAAPKQKSPAAIDDNEHCRYSSKAPNIGAAIDACDRLIKSGRIKGSDLVEIYESRMQNLRSARHFDRAIADATHIIEKLLPHKPQETIKNRSLRSAYYTRGSSSFWTKDYAKAVPDFSIVIRAFPDDYNALDLRGRSHLALKNFDLAVADFTETLRVHPQSISVYEFRARAYEQKNDLPNALADARRALEIEKGKGYSARSEQEVVDRIEKKVREAGLSPAPSAEPSRAAAAAPAPPSDTDELEPCIRSTAAPDSAVAIEHCNRLIASNRFDGEKLLAIYWSRTELHVHEKQFDRAVATVDEIQTKLLPTVTDAETRDLIEVRSLYVRAMTFLDLKEYPKALSELNSIIGHRAIIARQGRDISGVSHMRGQVHLAMNDADAAIADFNESIRLYDANWEAHRDRALAYEKKGDLPRALTDARRALEIAGAGTIGVAEARQEVQRIEQKIAAAPADAQACRRIGGNIKATIENCTRAIASGRFSGDELAKLYASRMQLFTHSLQTDQVIADAAEVVTKLLSQPQQGGVTGESIRDVYFWRGRAYLYNADFLNALADFDQILRDHPWHSSTLHWRGITHLEMNDADRAIADFSEAIRRDTAIPESSLQQRILAYEMKNDLRLALADARLLLERARAKGGTGESERKDVELIEQKIAAGPSAPKVTDDSLRCLSPTKAMKAMIDICSGLIASGRFQGDDLAALYESIIAYRNNAGQFDLALADVAATFAKIKHADGAGITSKNLANLYFVRGEAYLGARNYAKALSDFDTVIRYGGADADAFRARGRAHLEMNDLQSALADSSEAIRLDPQSHAAYRDRALNYERRGELTRALTDARRAVEIVDDIPYESSKPAREVLAQIEQKIAAGTHPTAAPEAAQRAPASVAAVAAVPPAQVAVAPQPVAPPRVVAASPPIAAPPAVVAAAPPPAVPAPVAPPPPVTVIPPGARVALVIGNGKYRHVGALNNPANDAADISAALRRIGFEVIEGLDLDKRGMDDKVREFGRKLDRAELAVFYYAGHGMQVNGKNYLLPVDGKLERPGDLNFDAMDVNLVIQQMEADQRVNLIFLDACRDNPLAAKFARSLGTRSSSVGRGLATIQGALGTMIGYATQPDALAEDGDGARNSPFTSAMLKHLNTPGLEIATLMRRVRADVVTATRGKQIPWDHSSLIGEVVLAR